MRYIIPGDPFRYVGTHRKPSTAARTAAKVAGLAVPLTLAGLAVVGATPLAAHAAVRPVNWEQKTCHALAAYNRHPTTRNLVTLERDSLNVPWKYLGGDVWELYGDVRAVQYDRPGQRPGDEQRESVALQYADEDCFGGA